MSTRQGNLKDYQGNKIAPNTCSAAVLDEARNRGLSASLAVLVEKNAFGFPAFVTTEPYSAGKILFYDRKLWTVKAGGHAAGAWDPDDFEEYHLGLDVLFLNQALGKFNTTETVALAVGQAGKYVNTSGGLTSNANFAVSAVIHLTAGRIYLLASDSALGASVAAFAKVLTGTEEVSIAYVYTYDNAGRPVTAVADYDAALVYTFHYDEDGNLESITDAGGSTVDHLPATRSVAYTRYRPLFFSGDQLPTSGFYVYNCIEDEDIVVSAHTASISGQSLTGVHYDVFTAIAYALKDRVEKDGDEMLALAQLVAILFARLDSLEMKLASGFGSLSVDNLRVLNRLDDFSTKGNANAHGEGAPNFIPDKPGQRYRDDVAKITYTAQDCKSVSDWKPDTNA